MIITLTIYYSNLTGEIFWTLLRRIRRAHMRIVLILDHVMLHAYHVIPNLPFCG